MRLEHTIFHPIPTTALFLIDTIDPQEWKWASERVIAVIVSGHACDAMWWQATMEAKNGKREEWKGSILPSLSLPITQFGSWCVCVLVLSCQFSTSLSLFLTPYLPISSPPKVSVFLQSLAAIWFIVRRHTASFFLTSVKNFLPFLTHSVTLSPSPSLYCLALILAAIGRWEVPRSSISLSSFQWDVLDLLLLADSGCLPSIAVCFWRCCLFWSSNTVVVNMSTADCNIWPTYPLSLSLVC